MSSTSQPAYPIGQPSDNGGQPQQSRQAAEEARKDRTLAEFMLMLDDYEPLVRAHHNRGREYQCVS
jgi:transcription initiation factor TFIID subunit 10